MQEEEDEKVQQLAESLLATSKEEVYQVAKIVSFLKQSKISEAYNKLNKAQAEAAHGLLFPYAYLLYKKKEFPQCRAFVNARLKAGQLVY